MRARTTCVSRARLEKSAKRDPPNVACCARQGDTALPRLQSALTAKRESTPSSECRPALFARRENTAVSDPRRAPIVAPESTALQMRQSAICAALTGFRTQELQSATYASREKPLQLIDQFVLNASPASTQIQAMKSALLVISERAPLQAAPFARLASLESFQTRRVWNIALYARPVKSRILIQQPVRTVIQGSTRRRGRPNAFPALAADIAKSGQAIPHRSVLLGHKVAPAPKPVTNVNRDISPQTMGRRAVRPAQPTKRLPQTSPTAPVRAASSKIRR